MLENNIDLAPVEAELIEWGKWEPDRKHYPSMKPCNLGRLIKSKNNYSSLSITDERAYEIDKAVSSLKNDPLYNVEWEIGVSKYRYQLGTVAICQRYKMQHQKVAVYAEGFVKGVFRALRDAASDD